MGGGWPTFRFLKGGIPHAYPAWDLWILRMRPLVLYFSGSSPDEKEARRCMSPRLPTFAKNKGAKVGHPPSKRHQSVALSSAMIMLNRGRGRPRHTNPPARQLRCAETTDRPAVFRPARPPESAGAR